MNKQLELEQEAKYMRLIGGKVAYVSESEALAEEVLTTTGDRLGEWNRLVQEANLVKERISVVYQMIRDDVGSESQYQVDYDMLWYRYREIVYLLRQINPESVDQFRDKVAARVKELGVRLKAMCDICDDCDSSDFDDLLRLFALYEKSYVQVAALSGVSPPVAG